MKTISILVYKEDAELLTKLRKQKKCINRQDYIHEFLLKKYK